MHTPVGAQPLEDAVIGTHHIYTFALALICVALVASTFVVFVD